MQAAWRYLYCVGGLDPMGASGVLADVRAVRDLMNDEHAPLWPIVVPTAYTLQTIDQGLQTQEAPGVENALQTLCGRHPPSAIKIGMVANPAQAEALTTFLKGLSSPIPCVIDPVLQTSSGLRLYQGEPSTLLPLLKQATLITPNIPEAQALSGTDSHEMEPLKEALHALGLSQLLLKGGHLTEESVITDVYSSRNSLLSETQLTFSHAALPYQVRGTGCMLATRIAAYLAQNLTMTQAITRAHQWLQSEYAAAWRLGSAHVLRGERPFIRHEK